MTPRTCPSGGACPSSGCPNYAHEKPRTDGLAWCLRDLPRGLELTQSEAAASIGISERQLRRIEIELRSALRELQAFRELYDKHLSWADPGDVRLPGSNVRNDDHASRAAPPPSPPDSTGSQRAVQLLPRRFPRRTP